MLRLIRKAIKDIIPLQYEGSNYIEIESIISPLLLNLNMPALTPYVSDILKLTEELVILSK